MAEFFAPVRELDEVAWNILQKRYFHPGETRWDQVVDRVVEHVVGGHPMRDDIHEMILNRYFIPNSPTLVNTGKPNGGLSACFVVDFQDDIEAIYRTKLDFARIARKGGGAGTTLRYIRPENSPVSGSAHGYAGGPLKFADTISHDMEALTQAGFRSMAIMFTQHVTHPDILKFIHAKTEEGKIANANISVVVNDSFMEAVALDETYWTEFGGKKYEELRARDVFQEIVEGAWKNGEPGLVFEEKVNNSPYAELGQRIDATNPCGEQGLPPNGVCNLGSLDLSKFIRDGELDWDLLDYAVTLSVNFLDAVIDVNVFPTREIQEWALQNRPVGLGVMGFADYLLLKGIAYGSEESLLELDTIMRFIYNIVLDESEKLAQKLSIPETLLGAFDRPRRNATLLSIAPTGTISLLAGCSSGIEPVFSEITIRTDKTGTYDIHHPLFSEPYFRCAVSANGATEVTWQEHVAVLEQSQKWVDAGVSKTINLPQSATRDTIAKAFMTAWASAHIKGLTVYRNQSRKQEVLRPKNLKKDKCPVCGEDLIKEGGCKHCSACEFSLCDIG